MASAESPIPEPEPSLYIPALLIALAILVSVVLALAALHFLLKKLRSRVRPMTPEAAWACHGVDEKILDSIPVQTFSKNCKFLLSEYHHHHDCSVCLLGFEEGEMIRILPSCRHVFHVQCIDTWFASNSSCPFCRSEITAVELLILPVGEVNEESDGGLNGEKDGEHQRSNSLLCCAPSDPSLMSFREKLWLKRCPSLDSCNV